MDILERRWFSWEARHLRELGLAPLRVEEVGHGEAELPGAEPVARDHVEDQVSLGGECTRVVRRPIADAACSQGDRCGPALEGRAGAAHDLRGERQRSTVSAVL